MKPICFKGCNCIYAKDQPEYLPLHVHKKLDGEVISCWEFNWRDRLKILFGAKLYWHQLTFNKPLQPVRAELEFNIHDQT
jgi:hypothetical protein